MPSIPEFDIAPFLAGGKTDRARLARKIDEICRDVGFFCLTGHGVDAARFEEIYAVSKAFFRLGLAEKRRVGQPAPDIVRGYLGLGAAALGYTTGAETPPDWKESFSAGPVDIDPSDAYYRGPLVRGHFVENRWPERPEGFGPIWTHYYRRMSVLAADLMRLFACALNLPDGFFADKIDRPIAILGAMYYPDQDRPPEEGQLRAGAHTDFGTLTILRPDDAPGGLQVWAKSGEWLPVQPPGGAFVVNIGDLMARWTNDRWVSTLHRVVNPPPGSTGESERLSIGFFHKANYDTLVDCLPSCRSPQNPPKYEPILAGEHFYRQFSSQAQNKTD